MEICQGTLAMISEMGGVPIASDTTKPSIFTISFDPWASLVAQHLPAMWETWLRSLGWEDPLEKEMATHSSILAWKIPWIQSTWSQRVGHD